VTDPEPLAGPPAAEPPTLAQSAPPSMSRWGRRVARGYLLVCGVALLAMLVETVTGRGGVGTMFAAILAAPWSMLVANLLPPLPQQWSLAAGLAVRLVLLASFMALNGAIVAGIAARSERDLAGARGTRG